MKQNKIKLSVIIPVYNSEKYIRECLDSIINQKLRDIEIICVNDGSSDGSLEILEEYAKKDKRIIVVNQENSGAGSARNKGISVANGDYLHFMDADDSLYPDVYKEIYSLAEKQNFPNIIRFKAIAFDNKTGKFRKNNAYQLIGISKSIINRIVNVENDINEILKLSVTPWLGIIRKDFVWENNLQFNSCKVCNDRSFFIMSMLLANEVYILNKTVVRHRVNNSISLRGIRHLHFDSHFESFKIISEFLQKYKIKKEIASKIIINELCDISNFYFDFQKNKKNEKEIEAITKDFFKNINYSDYYDEIKRRKLIITEYNIIVPKKLVENKKLSLIQNIFSIINVQNRKYKQITILGFKIKIKQ